MKTRLDESLTGAAGSYILPFFWQHGEDVLLLPSGSVLQVGGLNLACLILPYAQRLPFTFLQRLAGLAENGFPILFLEALPESSCSGENCGALLKRLAQSALVLPLHELASYLMEKKFPILSSASGSLYPDLRAYQYEGEGCGCVMLMNEHISSAVHDEIWFTDFEPEWEYDAYENCLYELEWSQKSSSGPSPVSPVPAKKTLTIHLEPGESRMYVYGTTLQADTIIKKRPHTDERRELTGRLTLSASTDNAHFYPVDISGGLQDLSLRRDFASFHGILRYELDFECGDEIEQMKDVCIYLDGANEITSVRLNGGEPVTRIGTPYRFPVGESIRRGHNHLVVENVTTVFPHVKDHPSINTPLHSMGLCGKVWMEGRRG